jgi:hypothetical protein
MPSRRTTLPMHYHGATHVTASQQRDIECGHFRDGVKWRQLLPVFLALVLVVPAAHGQTVFTWPKDSSDVSQYTTVDQCLAATRRVRLLGASNPSLIWRDTLPHTTASEAADARAPLPEPLTAVARQCTDHLTVATAPLSDFVPLLALTLLAGRDTAAGVLVQRRLKSIGAVSLDERAAVLDTVIAAYLGAWSRGVDVEWFTYVRPARLAPAESLVMQLSRMKAVPWQMRLKNDVALLEAAGAAADTGAARHAADAGIAVASSLTDAERRSNEFLDYGGALVSALAESERRTLLDSLRRSTAAYARSYRALWERVTGPRGVPSGFGKPIGEPAPQVTADYWFRRGDSTTARPTKGKVNLVVFFGPCEGTFARPDCQAEYAILRRLARRFPELELTLVARTIGVFGDAAPPSPSEEAAMLAHAWLDERHLPGAVAVTTTPFWRLPDPDRRRIARDTPNETNYSFARSWPVTVSREFNGIPAIPFLIDEQGFVVDANFGLRPAELEWPELIETLLSRHVVSRP